LKAVYNVNKIIKKAILNKNFDKQEDIDKFLIDLD
jgi:enolase